jgi:ribose 5-phosphate isomerase B
MKIFLGADHRGYELKNQLKDWLIENGHQIEDLGPKEYVKDDDFVEYAVGVSRAVVQNPEDRGIVICGSGAGAEIAANKIKRARCSLGQSVGQIIKARDADDINILALAGEFTDLEKAKSFIKTFLETPYNAIERHSRRISQIEAIEDKNYA